VNNKVALLVALVAILVPWQVASAGTVLPPDAAPPAQQILRLPNTGPEGPYLDEDLTIYNRQDGTDLIQEPLVVYDAITGKIHPVAAQSWFVSSDKLTWTFKIRKGVKFHDGSPLTAQDVAESWNKIVHPKTGVASARDIDKAMELGYNHPVGPLKLTDLVGLDIRLNIAEYLHVKLGSETFRPPEILRRMVSEGKLGKKSGEGFYKWNEPEQAQRAYTS